MITVEVIWNEASKRAGTQSEQIKAQIVTIVGEIQKEIERNYLGAEMMVKKEGRLLSGQNIFTVELDCIAIATIVAGRPDLSAYVAGKYPVVVEKTLSYIITYPELLTKSSESPQYYTRTLRSDGMGWQIEFYPPAMDNGTTEYKMVYYKAVSKPNSFSSSNYLLQKFPEVFILGTTARILEMVGADREFQTMEARYREALMQIQKERVFTEVSVEEQGRRVYSFTEPLGADPIF